MDANAIKAEIMQGEKQFLQGNFFESLQIFEAVLLKDQDNLAAMNNKGVALNKLGRYQEAIDTFYELLSKNNKHVSAVFNLISNCFALGKVSEAEKILEKYGDALNPQDAEMIRRDIEKNKPRTAPEPMEEVGQPPSLSPKEPATRMRLVQITEPKIDVDVPGFGEKRLLQGNSYLIHDAIARKIVDLNWGQIIGDEKDLSSLPREALIKHDKPLKVLFLFSGGLGDAVSVSTLFALLEKEYNMQIDICCHFNTWHYVLAPMGFGGKRVDFPIETKIIDQYDYIQIDITNFISDRTKKWEKCIVEELAKAYRVDLNKFHGNYSIPAHIVNSNKLPDTDKLRIGINFESKGRVKEYPVDIGYQLISALIGHGFEIHHFGTQPSNKMDVSSTDGYYEYLDKINIFELSALLKQMDLLVGVDSFCLHLADILGVKSIALLSTTKPGIYHWHKNIICMDSKVYCSPCGSVRDCPTGLNKCSAFYHESISPERIMARIIRECTCLFKNKFKAA